MFGALSIALGVNTEPHLTILCGVAYFPSTGASEIQVQQKLTVMLDKLKE